MAQHAAAQSGEDYPALKPWSHSMFYWNELVTYDAERARKFYTDTLGWTFNTLPMADGGTYSLAMLFGRMAGGIVELRGADRANTPEAWVAYIAVDDVDARVESALKAGATLMRPIFDIRHVGRIAMLREPGGASIGWMTPT